MGPRAAVPEPGGTYRRGGATLPTGAMLPEGATHLSASRRRIAEMRTTAARAMRHERVGSSVDLLHLGALIVVLLEGRQLLDVIRLVVVLDGEAELDHAVDAAGEGGGLVEREARGEQRGLEEQVDEVLDRLVALVG